jgi:hypothetical protein
MSTAQEKTANLKRINIPIEKLIPNKQNPNEMSDAEFNMLADNFEKTGFTDPALVRALPDGNYRIVGGHHRVEVAKLYDFKEIPCTVIDDPDFDEDQEKFQVVRMNVIRGRMSPQKFLDLFNSLGNKYTHDIMQEAFGFTDQEQFNKLVGQMATSLPKEMQSEFKKAAEDVKTIDGLSNLLNSMFAKYGDTLPFNYLLMDYGGKDSIWLRMHGSSRKELLDLAKHCLLAGVTLDSVMTGAIKHVLKAEDVRLQLIANGVKAQFKNGTTLPIEENAVVEQGSEE